MKPTKNCVGINILIKIINKITEDHSLLSSAMSSYPQPAVPHVIVNKEDVSFLEAVIKHKYIY